jgi:predicted RNA-binding Zn-ribbon protein involved in translation (DUF1610 family)
MVAGALGGVVGFVWLALSVRCAACGTRIVWRAMSNKAASAWLAALASLESCPACGDRGDGTERIKPVAS